jgi:hypothetical protein
MVISRAYVQVAVHEFDRSFSALAIALAHIVRVDDMAF